MLLGGELLRTGSHLRRGNSSVPDIGRARPGLDNSRGSAPIGFYFGMPASIQAYEFDMYAPYL